MKFVHIVKYNFTGVDESIFNFHIDVVNRIQNERHMIYQWNEKHKKYSCIREYNIRNKQIHGYDSNKDNDFLKRSLSFKSLKDLLNYFDIDELNSISDSSDYSSAYSGFIDNEYSYAFEYEAEDYKNDNFKYHFIEFNKQLLLILKKKAEESNNTIKALEKTIKKVKDNKEKMLLHNWNDDCLMITQ